MVGGSGHLLHFDITSDALLRLRAIKSSCRRCSLSENAYRHSHALQTRGYDKRRTITTHRASRAIRAIATSACSVAIRPNRITCYCPLSAWCVWWRGACVRSFNARRMPTDAQYRRVEREQRERICAARLKMLLSTCPVRAHVAEAVWQNGGSVGAWALLATCSSLPSTSQSMLCWA